MALALTQPSVWVAFSAPRTTAHITASNATTAAATAATAAAATATAAAAATAAATVADTAADTAADTGGACPWGDFTLGAGKPVLAQAMAGAVAMALVGRIPFLLLLLLFVLLFA